MKYIVNNLSLWGMLMVLFLVSSCKSVKDITYLQDMEYLREYKARYDSKATIKPEDNIRIVVSSSRLELAAPFNQSTTCLLYTSRCV